MAVLLWWRHPRARFAAYVYLTAVGLRGLVTGEPVPVGFAVVLILALQTGPARAAWPRLRPGRLPGRQ